MKTMKILITLFLIISFGSCISTQIIPGSHPEDNTIIIKTNQKSDDALKQLVQILTSEGFSIENIDKDLFIISTGPKKTSRLNASLKANFLINGNENASIILTGLVAIDASINMGYGVMSNSGWNRIENRGMNGSVLQVAWNDLYNLAQRYPSGEVFFEKR